MKKTLVFALSLIALLTYAQEKSPNIILLIGDGMGLTQISSGMYANNNQTVLEEFPYIGLSKTYAADQLVTDSAASGTAMAAGVKTFNGVLGIDEKNVAKKSILEYCSELGYKTALLATSSIVHATPASFYAKIHSRREYEAIALQLSEHNVDLFVGGGKKFFADRKDKRNLITEMDNYTFVKSIQEFKKSDSKKIGYLTYDGEPPSLIEGRKPALNELTEISLEKMNATEKPFFMMVEGSQIDWGGHDNDAEYLISELLDFDKTIGVALDFARENRETLVVVTADHETGGFTLGSDRGDYNNIKPTFSTDGHSATMIPVFSMGPGEMLFGGVYENTEIYHKMKALFSDN